MSGLAGLNVPHQFSADPSVGEFILRFRDDSWCMVIEKADPRILLAADFLDHIRGGVPARLGVTIEGDVLRIKAPERTVVYRIGEKSPDGLAYYAQWPD